MQKPETDRKTSDSKKCPQCGGALPSTLDELCPACLLRQGAMETGTVGGAAPFEPPAVGEVAKLFPQLEILAFIGKGGMGAVYKARQLALDRLVALKILPLQAARGPAFGEMFNREARALAKLNHPNIVAVHEFGQVEGLPFFLMEFVDGLNLRQLEQAGRLSPREALGIVPQICEALQFAHDEGIVHRDIKPENILIDKKGRVKIADFGIAKLMGREPDPSAETGRAVGTPNYMAPEQAATPLEVDHRADIYALGVVFYEMLTGELPLGKFAAPSRKVQIDVRLDEVVLRALEKEPGLRYQQAGEVKTAVETISLASAASSPVRPAAARNEPASPGMTGRMFGRGALAALLLLAVAGAAVFLFGIRSRPLDQKTEEKIVAQLRERALKENPLPGLTGTETNAPASAELWSPTVAPGGKPEPEKVRQEGQELARAGQYEQALQRHIWYHNHALEYGVVNPVRLSFGLADWTELARKYPRAKQAMVETRDRQTKEFAEGRGYFDLFQEVAALNNCLRDDAATCALFKGVAQRDPQLAANCFFVAKEYLVKHGEYDLCLKFIPDYQAAFDRIWQGLERDKKMAQREAFGGGKEFRKATENRFVEETCQLIEILLATDHKAEAGRIQEQAAAASADPRLKTALEDASQRIATVREAGAKAGKGQ